jgi:hypothetical protein
MSIQAKRELIANTIYLCHDHGGYGFREDCFVCKKDFGPNLREWIEYIDEKVKSEFLVGISGHNFVDHFDSIAVVENGEFKKDDTGNIVYTRTPRKANSSPVLYCLTIARQEGKDVEETAKNLLTLHKSFDSGEFVKVLECRNCLAFIPASEMAEHKLTCN